MVGVAVTIAAIASCSCRFDLVATFAAGFALTGCGFAKRSDPKSRRPALRAGDVYASATATMIPEIHTHVGRRCVTFGVDVSGEGESCRAV
jgi:hypothetical protein